ncbi:sensor domain-containing diguanylate cyclase [Planococcus sp. CAU13]|uniref:sensor domain-containing diguanylate cyclase n=1 Tax=Planococcus sp. CAU13 TaxID=1541197 RepID=UPI00052FFB17|nr:sensor domain-containing diguanylate cyclase [Planococcus sp. CAU13]
MDEQLDLAPAGYLVMDQNLKIMDMNRMMLEIAGIEQAPDHMHDLLTIASRVYFQTYFIPAIMTHGTVSEMYLKLKSPGGPVPVLMNTRKRNGLFECVIMQVSVRNEYETELLNAKREAEGISRATEEANSQLKKLLNEVECKQAELNILNDRLKELTVTDVLTGLKNRRYLEEFLPELMAADSLYLLMIDIDYFKRVNDTYGHHAGDVVLKKLAEVLKGTIGKAGFAARLGGEEFVAVLPAMDTQKAAEMAEQIRRNVELFDWPYRPITVSIGLACNLGGDALADLLNRADAALYESKNNGRNRVTVAI